MKNEEFDKIIREKLRQANPAPPAAGWEGISAEIHQVSFPYLKVVSIVTLVMLLGGGLYFFGISTDQVAYDVDETVDHPTLVGGIVLEDNPNYQSYKVITEDIQNSGNPGKNDQNSFSNTSIHHNNQTSADEIEYSDKLSENEVTSKDQLASNSNNSNQELESVDEEVANEEKDPVFFLLPKSFEFPVAFHPGADIRQVKFFGIQSKNEVTNPVKEKNKTPFINGIYAEAQSFLNYNRVKPNTEDNIVVTGLKNNKFNERLGYNFSIGAHKSLSSKIFVYAGLNYQTYLSKVSYQYTERLPDSVEVEIVNDQFFGSPVLNQRDGVLEQRVNSLGIDFGLKYIIESRNFNNVFNVGLLANSAINGDQLEFIRREQLFLKVGYGVFYQTKSPWVIYAQPSLSYSLLQEMENGGIFQVQPFSLGLSLGVKYNFSQRK